MTRVLDLKLPLGVAVLVAVLVANAAVTYRNTRQLDDDARWVTHTYEVLDALADLHTALRAAQTGQRGYLLTGDRQFLEPYESAGQTYGEMLDRVGRLTADNPVQLARTARLRGLVADHFARLERGIGEYDRREAVAGRAAAVAQMGEGKRVMEAVRGLIREMEAEETGLLAKREDARGRAYAAAVAGGAATLAVGLAAVAGVVWLGRRHLRDRDRVAAARYQQEFLEGTVTSIGDGVIVTDTAGRVTMLNHVAERLTGWTRAAAAGQPLETVFWLKPCVGRAAAGTGVLVAKDGTEWPVDNTTAPLRAAGAVAGAVIVFREVGTRVRAERAAAEAGRRRDELLDQVRASEAKYRETIDRLGEGVLVVEAPTGRFVEVNAAVLEMLGYTRAEFLALTPADVNFGEPPDVYARNAAALLAAVARDGRCDVGRRRLRRKDGSAVQVDMRVRVVPDGGAGLHAIILRDLTEQIAAEDRLFEYQSQLEAANERLRAFATTDGLTRVKNRAAFDDKLAEEFDRAARSGRPLSVVMIDVDHFKAFNDAFGHPAGDEVLKAVAAALRAAVRGTDVVARYGGEEFAVILPDTDADGAVVLAERCRREVAAADWEKRRVTVSVGVATLAAEATAAAVVKAADDALYRAKQAGRNRVAHAGTAARATAPA